MVLPLVFVPVVPLVPVEPGVLPGEPYGEVLLEPVELEPVPVDVSVLVEELPVPPSVELLELGSELVALVPSLLGPLPVDAPDEPMPLLPVVPGLVSVLLAELPVELLELGLEVAELLVSDPLPVPPRVALLELGSELVALVPSLLGPLPVDAPDEPMPLLPVVPVLRSAVLLVEPPYDPLPLCAYAPVPASASAPATTNVYRSFIVSPCHVGRRTHNAARGFGFRWSRERRRRRIHQGADAGFAWLPPVRATPRHRCDWA